MAKRVTRVAGMSPLQALVTERMRTQGWDAPTVESRGVSHATLHRYMNPLVLRQLPRASVLTALAKALELDVEEVREAAKDSVGELQDRPWRRSLELAGPGPHNMSIVISRRDRMPMSHEEFVQGLKEVESRLGVGYAEQWETALTEEGLINATATTKADVEHAGVGRPEDYTKAARKGTPRQVLIDANKPDLNVDPEGPEGGA